MKRLLHRLFNRHVFTNKVVVSGYGLTEYEISFCKYCPKVFAWQTKNFNGN